MLGSAVNPVLREGNSDRRAPVSVKKHSQKYPHKMMKPWPDSSKCRVAHMQGDDFFGTENSVTLSAAGSARIEFVDASGKAEVLKKGIKLQAGEVIDSSCMKVASLQEFFAKEIEAAKKDGVLFSLHMKATMMKVSDPIIFGHAVKVFYREVFEKHADTFKEIGVNANNGLADVYYRIEKLDAAKKAEIEADIAAVYEKSADLAMVDSRKGITNLHVPNNVIIDASMPNVVRDGGKMWNKSDELQECIAVIPDRSYATMYQAVIEDCQKSGQFDPATMGSVANVGVDAVITEENPNALHIGLHVVLLHCPHDWGVSSIPELFPKKPHPRIPPVWVGPGVPQQQLRAFCCSSVHGPEQGSVAPPVRLVDCHHLWPFKEQGKDLDVLLASCGLVESSCAAVRGVVDVDPRLLQQEDCDFRFVGQQCPHKPCPPVPRPVLDVYIHPTL